MFRNYFNVAVRNLVKHRFYSVINVLGLAIGMTCCLLIFLYVQHELSYDTFHTKADRIYRVVTDIKTPTETLNIDVTSAPMPAYIKADFPEVEDMVRFGQLFIYFAGLAIFIACLGLLGLISYTIVQRTKEIGIRKVLGASESSIVRLLSQDFLVLVLVAFVIAAPVAWYALQQWLAGFAYRVALPWWIFALAGLLATVIAMLTVSFQSVRAATANPVDSLRNE